MISQSFSSHKLKRLRPCVPVTFISFSNDIEQDTEGEKERKKERKRVNKEDIQNARKTGNQ